MPEVERQYLIRVRREGVEIGLLNVAIFTSSALFASHHHPHPYQDEWGLGIFTPDLVMVSIGIHAYRVIDEGTPIVCIHAARGGNPPVEDLDGDTTLALLRVYLAECLHAVAQKFYLAVPVPLGHIQFEILG